MADKEKNILLRANFQDNASSGISKLGKNSDSVSASIGKGFKAASIAITVAMATATAAIAGTIAAADRLGGIQEITAGFQRNFGGQADALNKLQKASDGMISSYDLMRLASKAAIMGVTKDVDKLGGIMKTAQYLSDEMGTSFQDTYEGLVEGIGKGSDRMLKALGIVVPQALSEAMLKMSDTEKTAALMNFVIQSGVDISKQYGDAQMSAADKVEALKAKMTDLKDGILVKLEPVITPLLDLFTRVATWLGTNIPIAIDTMKRKWEEFKQTDTFKVISAALEYIWDLIINKLVPSFKSLFDSITEQLASMGIKWEDIIKVLAFIFGTVLLGAITAVILIVTGLNDAIKFMVEQGTKVVNTLKGAFEATKKMIEDVITTVQNLINKIKGIPDKKVSVTYGAGSAGGSGGGGGSFATGGITGGGMTMVHKDEMIDLPRGTHVYNKEDSKNMGGGSNITINIQAPVYGINDLKSSILEAVNEATARQNRLANYNLL